MGFYNLINQTQITIDNNCNKWGLMSKINDAVKTILGNLIKIVYNINYNFPVNVGVCPLVKQDLTIKEKMVPY